MEKLPEHQESPEGRVDIGDLVGTSSITPSDTTDSLIHMHPRSPVIDALARESVRMWMRRAGKTETEIEAFFQWERENAEWLNETVREVEDSMGSDYVGDPNSQPILLPQDKGHAPLDN